MEKAETVQFGAKGVGKGIEGIEKERFHESHSSKKQQTRTVWPQKSFFLNRKRHETSQT